MVHEGLASNVERVRISVNRYENLAVDKMSGKHKEYLENARSSIADQVRTLRGARRWTQRELAEKIGLSQGRLSEVERGDGSFTAEQLLLLLQLFNVPLGSFGPVPRKTVEHADLQNALARLGAAHLQESDQVLPSERLDEVGQVVKEALVVAAPRLLAAVAPVLAQQIDRLSLSRLDAELRTLGLDRRLPWLVENVLEAIRDERKRALPREIDARYRRAETVLQQYLETAIRRSGAGSRDAATDDVLDGTIRSRRTLEQVRGASSAISRRWGVVTSLQPIDFGAALEAARAGT